MWVSGNLRSALRSAPLLVWLFWAGMATAQPKTKVLIEGHVLQIDDVGIVVDLAGARGARDGDIVELWRPLRLRHPVTGKQVVDRFMIGRLKLTQVRDRLALAKLEGKPSRPIDVGDVVILEREPEPGAEPEAEPPVKQAAPTPAKVEDRTKAPRAAFDEQEPSDPEAATVSKLFESLRGASVRARILAYENYVRARPNGRFAVVLYEEAAQLRRLVALEKAGRAEKADSGSEPVRLTSFAEPKSALAGVPLTIGIEIAGDASGAVLHSRRDGEVAYVSTPMTAIGTGYYAVTVPGDRMQSSKFHYFIEATNPAGEALPVVASAEQPNTTTVHDIPTPTPPQRHESMVYVLTDYADWNNLKGNDVVWQTEGAFGMRFRDIGLRAARTGFGVYRGVGGSLQELDELELSGRKVGLTYGYLEGEFGISQQFSLIGRAVVGLHDDGMGTGAQALLRIGSDKKTNLRARRRSARRHRLAQHHPARARGDRSGADPAPHRSHESTRGKQRGRRCSTERSHARPAGYVGPARRARRSRDRAGRLSLHPRAHAGGTGVLPGAHDQSRRPGFRRGGDVLMVTRAAFSLVLALGAALGLAARAEAQTQAAEDPPAAEAPSGETADQGAQPAEPAAQAALPSAAIPRLHHAPVPVAEAHEDLLIEAEITHPELVRRALLVYRTAADATLREVEFRRGVEHYVASIPADHARWPWLAYAIEIERLDGTKNPIFATREQPHRVQVPEDLMDVRERVLFERLSGRRSVVSTSGEYVSFGRSETDQVDPISGDGERSRRRRLLLSAGSRLYLPAAALDHRV